MVINPYAAKAHSYKGQLHCHTTNSDGAATPAVLAEAYLAAGYDFLAISDHDFMTPDTATPGLLYVPNSEETAADGHILNLGGTATIASTVNQTILDTIVSQGGVALMAHPNYYAIGWTPHILDTLEGISGVAVYNYECSGLAGGPTYEAIWDYLLSEGKYVVGFAEDDAHALVSIDHGWVQVFSDTATAAEIVESIRVGNFYSSQGPTITIAVTASGFTVTTPAAATIAFIGKGGATLQTSAAATTATYTFTGKEMYVRAVITRTSDGKIAWTNPVYIKRTFSNAESTGQRVRGNFDVVEGTLTANQRSLNLTTLTAPTAPTAALGSGAGNVDNGAHLYKMTFVTAIGETSLGTASGAVTVIDKTTNGKVELTALPVDVSGRAISRKLYRTAAGGTDYFYLATITNNIQTTYQDNIADASLGTVVYNDYPNHAGASIFFNGTVAGFMDTNITCFGYRAGRLNIDGLITAFGADALYHNTTGDASAFGYMAGYYNTTGQVALFGLYAGVSNTIGNSTAFGYQAGYSNTEGNLVAIGWRAGYYNVTGANIFLGYSAGASATYGPRTDTYGILIGYAATRSVEYATALTNYIGIGKQVAIDKSNQVKIGNTSITETQFYGSLYVYSGGDDTLIADEVKTSTLANTIGGTLMVFDSTNGKVGFFRVEGGAIVSISANAIFALTKDNAATINIYYETNVIKIQNKTAGTLALKYRFDGIGA
jgi:hypothetical protein